MGRGKTRTERDADARYERTYPGYEVWKARIEAIAELADWRAGMWPFPDAAPPTLTLTSPSYPRERMTESYKLTGTTPEWLIERALEIAAAERGS